MATIRVDSSSTYNDESKVFTITESREDQYTGVHRNHILYGRRREYYLKATIVELIKYNDSETKEVKILKNRYGDSVSTG